LLVGDRGWVAADLSHRHDRKGRRLDHERGQGDQ
jgi:hypothetical protein